MISKIQISWREFRDLTVIRNFQTGLETTIFETEVGFLRPFNPNSLYSSTLPRTGWVVSPKPTLCPSAGNPRYVRHCMWQMIFCENIGV